MPETSRATSTQRPRRAIDIEAWVCPMPLRDSPNIVMGHGGGGAMSAELIEHLFLPAFGSAADAGMGDAAVVEVGGVRLAFSTDSFVVKPMVFPGGTIGDLAVNGTVNDLAMAGARPLVLSTAFILEEGTPLDEIAHVAQALGTAALAAGVKLVTGDTKVVDSGHGDGVYINTAGIGIVDDRADIRPQRATPGDVVIVSGDIGVHGVAVMSCREGLEFATTVASDTAPLHGLVAAMLDTGADVHVLRDPTTRRRGRNPERDREDGGGRHRARRARLPHPRRGARRMRSARPRSAARSPTRASCWRSCRPMTLNACSPQCTTTRWGLAPQRSAPASPSTPAWWSRGRRWAAPGWSTCRSANSCPGSADVASPTERQLSAGYR